MIESDKMKPSPQRIFWLSLSLYILLLFVPDKKIGLVVIAVFVGYLLRITNMSEALVLSFFVLSPLTVGKQFLIELVSSTQLHILGRPFGISADIVLTARDGIAALMALMVASDAYMRRRIVALKDPLGKLLFIIPVSFMAASLMGSILPGFSMLHALFYWEPFILCAFLAASKYPIRREVIVAGIIATVLFESVFALLQLVWGGPLGLAIEYFPEYAPLDMSRDVGGAVVRMGGTFAHANLLASYLVFMLPVILPWAFHRKNGVSHYAVAGVLLGTLALLATLSRASWIGVSVAFLLFFYLAEKRLRMRLGVPDGLTRWSKGAIIVLVLVGGIAILPRLGSTLYTFERYGSVETRMLLIAEAAKAIRTHPLFGVGLAMDVYYMFQQARATSYGESVFTYFPEPVHNGFLKLFVETGLAGLVPYLITLGFLGARLYAGMRRTKGTEGMYQAGLFAAGIAVLINIQFQPILPDLQQLVPLIIIYGYFVRNTAEI